MELFGRSNKKEGKDKNEFSSALNKILIFKRIFLNEELRYMPIKAFIQFEHTESMLKDFKLYRKSAIYVMNKLNNPLGNDAVKLAEEELNISIGREWVSPPLFLNQYYILQHRSKDVIGLDIKKDDYLILCAFIITIHNEILNYKYKVGKYTP